MSNITMTDRHSSDEVFVCKSSFDNLEMKGRHWPVRYGRTRAVILIIHGSGEHCQRYRHVAQFFNTHQIACISFDWRGHGISEGDRGFAPCLTALFDDLESVIKCVRRVFYPNTPLITYSHGTGSLICLGHNLQRSNKPLDCQAMIISTPSLCLRRRPTSLLLFFSRAFAHLNPHFRLPVEGNYTNVYTTDPEVVTAYRNDPLVHDRWPATTVAIFLEIACLSEKNIFRPSCPTLIQHGTADNITPIQGVRKWIRKKVRGDVLFKEWPGHLHELHNDLNKEEILNFDLDWIEKILVI